nr:helix-turn-helix domain-containing protein [Desulfoglaeba alkanexedens]
MNHAWPGNVRELKGTLEYAFVIAETGLIRPEHLPAPVTGTPYVPPQAEPVAALQPGGEEKTQLIRALKQAGGNQSEAASIHGVSRVTVWNRMKRHGIDLKRIVAAASRP